MGHVSGYYALSWSKAADCPFCSLPTDRVILSDPLAVAVRDAFPVSRGHTLILPRRHISSFFEVTEEEQTSLLNLLAQAREGLDDDLDPAGYNIGINDGVAAGQTVPHLHIHLIPRYSGDCQDPRGGVRWVIPAKAKYWDD
ncbi:MAG TPA: HIT family protein [Gammaproteobacteria bacterium]|nr:HIT family protein [Gammaproteobacteria bacterium]